MSRAAWAGRDAHDLVPAEAQAGAPADGATGTCDGRVVRLTGSVLHRLHACVESALVPFAAARLCLFSALESVTDILFILPDPTPTLVEHWDQFIVSGHAKQLVCIPKAGTNFTTYPQVHARLTHLIDNASLNPAGEVQHPLSNRVADDTSERGRAVRENKRTRGYCGRGRRRPCGRPQPRERARAAPSDGRSGSPARVPLASALAAPKTGGSAMETQSR